MTTTTISKICSVEGCDTNGRTKIVRGLCVKHYKRQRRHGHTETLINCGLGRSHSERFWSKVEISTPDKCWRWLGICGTNGYGQTAINSKHMTAHRAAWFYTHGSLPGLFLLHSCDNRRCCNPHHLRPGTQTENMVDMVSRGRAAKGVNNARAKLTDSDIREIRNTCVPLKVGANVATPNSLTATAKRFGVSIKTIQNIVECFTWRHVE